MASNNRRGSTISSGLVTFYNDFKAGAKEEYCGIKFLGECFDKDIGPDAKVTGDINPSWWQLPFGTERHLCIKSVTFSGKDKTAVEIPMQKEGLGKRRKWNGCFCYFHSANADWFEDLGSINQKKIDSD